MYIYVCIYQEDTNIIPIKYKQTDASSQAGWGAAAAGTLLILS